jgi:hypothetical protein
MLNGKKDLNLNNLDFFKSVDYMYSVAIMDPNPAFSRSGSIEDLKQMF